MKLLSISSAAITALVIVLGVYVWIGYEQSALKAATARENIAAHQRLEAACLNQEVKQ